MNKILLSISLCLSLLLGTLSPAFSRKAHARRFAIFTDIDTYRACREEIDAYRAVLEQEGLHTCLFAEAFKRPEEVKAKIADIAGKKPVLEGVVFIGKIPVARIRQGQHLTTAFKMNEKTFPMTESSVSSDRFYDCLSLQFDYIGQDGENEECFYYNLSARGSQVLRPDFYSARMKVPRSLAPTDAEAYALLRSYLKKVAAAHREQNRLDKFCYFSGQDYNSDCLTAWRQQSLVFKEYFPQAFEHREGNTFLNFRQDPYMKFKLYDKIQEPDLDLMLFYEHGSPEKQYINSSFPAKTHKEILAAMQRDFRSRLRHYGKDSAAAAKIYQELTQKYHLNPETVFTEAYRREDSIENANLSIQLEDLQRIRPGARISILNACYNGAFHEDGYVAGYHIFNPGRTVVVQGNTVNVLQDKWAEQLIGCLGMGLRVGSWQNEVLTLESHLIGDPTFRFYSPRAGRLEQTLHLRAKAKEWKRDLEEDPLVRALAVKHARLDSKQLYRIFCTDPSWIVALQSLLRLAPLADSFARAAVLRGFAHPYEMIRRQCCHLAGRMGDESFIAPLVETVLFASDVQRVSYAAQSALGAFEPYKVAAEYKKQLDDSHLTDKEALLRTLRQDLQRKAARIEKQFGNILDTERPEAKRETDIRSLRNCNIHYRVNELLEVLGNPSEKTAIRISLCEALGWFQYSYRKEDIVSFIRKQLKKPLEPALKNEMTKTYKRLRGI